MDRIQRRPSARYLDALGQLHSADNDARKHFDALSRDAKADAVRRMANDGHSDYAIAHATGVAVEQVRAILAEKGR